MTALQDDPTWPKVPLPAPAIRLSALGLEFLQRHEGFRSRLYNDSAGHATIGYGHLVHKGAVGTILNLEAPFVNGISKSFGAALLAKDVGAATAAVVAGVNAPLLAHQWDALISFTFNVGVGAFKLSTLLRRVNQGASLVEIRAAFLMWIKPVEVTGRRTAEADLYCLGRYV